MLLVADNVIYTYNYPNLLTTICKHAPIFVVKVSRPYFSTSPQGAHEKFGLGMRLDWNKRLGWLDLTRPLFCRLNVHQHSWSVIDSGGLVGGILIVPEIRYLRCCSLMFGSCLALAHAVQVLISRWINLCPLLSNSGDTLDGRNGVTNNFEQCIGNLEHSPPYSD